jgi:hypothetical protein
MGRRITNAPPEVVNHLSLPSSRTKVVRQAYDDVLAGLPFCDAYEDWEAYDQLNYERARLYALNILTAKMPFPPWPMGAEHPPIFWNILHASIRHTGDPIPLEKAKILELVRATTEV